MSQPTMSQTIQLIRNMGIPNLVSGMRSGFIEPMRALSILRTTLDSFTTDTLASDSLTELQGMLRKLPAQRTVDVQTQEKIGQQLITNRVLIEQAVRALETGGVVALHPEAPFDLGPELQWIPAGAFLVGSAKDDPYVERRTREVMEPYSGMGTCWGVTHAPAYKYDRIDFVLHEVELGGFYIPRHLISNAELKAFFETTGRDDTRNLPEQFAGDDQPAVNVNIRVAADFSSWYGEQLRRKTGYPVIGRLPTEYEWEKAAKGPNGNEYMTPATPEEAHFAAEATRAVTSTDAKPNGYDLYDMIGNAAEWTSGKIIHGGHVVHGMVIRGGSYRDKRGSKHLRAASRQGRDNYAPPGDTSLEIGLRPLITL